LRPPSATRRGPQPPAGNTGRPLSRKVDTGQLASAPEAESVTGRYFANRKPKTSSKASYDTAAAARLWQTSADLTRLNTRGRETPTPPDLT